MISITSNRHNFRRCGIAHPKEAKVYPDDRFTADELEILKAEPMLSVQVIPDPKPPPEPPPVMEAAPEPGIDPNISHVEVKDQTPTIVGVVEERPDPPPEERSPLPPIDPDADLVAAAKMAVDAGDTIGSGAPTVSAMEAILGRNISAADRDRAWEKLQADDGLIAVNPPLKGMDEPALKKLLDQLNITYETDTPKGELILLVERNTAEVSAGE